MKDKLTRKIPPKPHCVHQEDCPVVIEAVNAQLAHSQEEHDQAIKETLQAVGEWLEMQMVIGVRRLEWLKPTDRLDFYFKKADLMAFKEGHVPEDVEAFREAHKQGTLPEGMVK